ncbi:MAG: hypothetical protein KDC54_04060 [Lewinella sp.]|nr:hypothetical protein [Lewinella sp.]
MPRIFFFLLLLCTTFMLTCDKNDRVEIRLENQTGKDFVSVYVNSNGAENNYPSLANGDRSAYKAYERAYGYGYVEAITTVGDTLFVQPIDYVGETGLDNGQYTYVLTLSDPGNRYMGITLERD